MKEKVDVTIIDYDFFGRGISKENGITCFVPKTRIGYQGTCTIQKKKKHFLLATISKEEAPKTDCPFFFDCGGCAIRHLDRKDQLDFKREKVMDLLRRNAKITSLPFPLKITPTVQDHYRNKATLHIHQHELGYFREDSNILLPIQQCLLLSSKINEIIKQLLIFAKDNAGDFEVMIRCFQEKGMVSITQSQLGHPDFSALQSIDSLYYQGKRVRGDAFLEIKLLDTFYQVYPSSFFQVNLKGMEILYKILISYLKEVQGKKILDLYCGVGSISLAIAPYVEEVYGVEIVKDAIINANQNKKINQISNVQFVCGKVESLLEKLPKNYDTVIVDPPRKGLDQKTREYLLHESFQTILYISCDPATFTRDLSILKERYNLEKLELVDMFPNTYHVECVCILNLR